MNCHDIDELKPIGPRKNAPLFKAKAVLNDKFVDITLDQYVKEGKWTVLLFYPFDYTFVCPTEIIAFSDRAADFHKIGCEVNKQANWDGFVFALCHVTQKKKLQKNKKIVA